MPILFQLRPLLTLFSVWVHRHKKGVVGNTTTTVYALFQAANINGHKSQYVRIYRYLALGLSLMNESGENISALLRLRSVALTKNSLNPENSRVRRRTYHNY